MYIYLSSLATHSFGLNHDSFKIVTFLRVWDVLPVCHFSDEYYTATSYGDRFSAVLLQLSFTFQHHVRRQT